MMSKERDQTGGNCSYYFEDANPCIVIEPFETSKDVKIAINGRNLMLEFTIPEKSLKKLLIASQKSMGSGKRSSFCQGDFIFGEVGESKMIPEEKILGGGA